MKEVISESLVAPRLVGVETNIGNVIPWDNNLIDPLVIGIEGLSETKVVEVLKEKKEMEEYPFRQDIEELIRSPVRETQERK